MSAGNGAVVLGCETLQEYTPLSFGLTTFPHLWRTHSIYLEGHKMTVQPVEQSLSDAQHNVVAVNGVVKWQHQGCALLGNTEVPMSVLICADSQ